MVETVHIGKKISKIRELRGMKQETLATALGISQQAISKIEQSAELETETLDKIAKVLQVSSEAIRNFSEEALFNIIGNTYSDNSSSVNYQCAFNPIEKIVALYDEKVALLERLLKSESEKTELYKRNSNEM